METPQVHFQEETQEREGPGVRQQNHVQNYDEGKLREKIQERDFAVAAQKTDNPKTTHIPMMPPSPAMHPVPLMPPPPGEYPVPMMAPPPARPPVPMMHRAAVPMTVGRDPATAHRKMESDGFFVLSEKSPQVVPTVWGNVKSKLRNEEESKATMISTVTADDVLSTTSRSTQDSSPASQGSSDNHEDDSSTSEDWPRIQRKVDSLRNRPSWVKRLRKMYGEDVMAVKNDHLDVNFASLQQVHLEVLQRRLLSMIFTFTYYNVESVEAADCMLELVEESTDLMGKYGNYLYCNPKQHFDREIFY